MNGMFKNLARELSTAGVGRVLRRAKMRQHTTLGVGGPADVLVYPRGLQELKQAIEVMRAYGAVPKTVGLGSNLVVLDGGVRTPLLDLSDGFREVAVEGSLLLAEAGVPVTKLLRAAVEASLSGVEFLTGVPGTVGGAVATNAGGGERPWTGDRLAWIEFIDRQGDVQRREAAALTFDYRHFAAPAELVALVRAAFALTPARREQVELEMGRRMQTRVASQPIGERSAGCIFRNPEQLPAGRLIDELGLKGTVIGDALISPKHANFIVNRGRAKAADVLSLIELVQNRAFEERGIKLCPEVEILGEESES